VSPRTDNQNKYILIIVDYATRYLWTEAMPTCKRWRVIKALKSKVTEVFGFPHTTYCDNARNFTHGPVASTLKEAGVIMMFPPPYSPSSVGLSESFVKMVKKGLRAGCASQPDMIYRWDKLLSGVTHSLNVRTLRGIGFTPSELLFGFNPKKSLEIPTVEDNLRVSMLEYQHQTGQSLPQTTTEILYGNRMAILDEIRDLSIRRRIQKQSKPGKNPQ